MLQTVTQLQTAEDCLHLAVAGVTPREGSGAPDRGSVTVFVDVVAAAADGNQRPSFALCSLAMKAAVCL